LNQHNQSSIDGEVHISAGSYTLTVITIFTANSLQELAVFCVANTVGSCDQTGIVEGNNTTGSSHRPIVVPVLTVGWRLKQAVPVHHMGR
jgi:hypothetical protein